MDDLKNFCCQNPDCLDYGRRGCDNLRVCFRNGPNKDRRVLACRTCQKRFAERKGTALYRGRGGVAEVHYREKGRPPKAFEVPAHIDGKAIIPYLGELGRAEDAAKVVYHATSKNDNLLLGVGLRSGVFYYLTCPILPKGHTYKLGKWTIQRYEAKK
jgi:hypothetical protein